MKKQQRELERALIGIADQNTARLVGVWRTSQGHLRWVFAKGSSVIHVTSGSNRSDYRANRNVVASANRVLRRLSV
jgi:hypothetical protein